jgi:aminoglycoside phosphotransferase (APT) family kinase protein
VRVSREERMAVKCARTELVRQTLGRQRSVLAALHADERLGPWRRLLPRVVACDLEASPPWKVESWLPGVSGATLLRRRPAVAGRLTKAALEAIEELHRATGRPERVDATHLARWVDEPIAVLRQRLRPYRQDGYEASLVALRERLHRQLHGRELSIGWVHRDYHPGNVLYTREGRHVSGIVDWGGAVPDGPTELDRRLFGLAVARQTDRRMFGELVIEALRDGDDGLLLLAWLWHVTDNLDKSARFVASRLWTGRNILDVLEAVNP